MSDPKGNGFIFAATGAKYVNLARRAVRSLRQVMPDAQVDLFTDAELVDPAFDRIHKLSDSYFRPKMEAMRRTRFERTVYLDCDIVVLMDVSELFQLLDRFDLASSFAFARDGERLVQDGTMPRSFGLLNAGVIAIKTTEKTKELVANWDQTVRERDADMDQPTLRELLWKSDLSMFALPQEYNLIAVWTLDTWRPKQGAPRILHSQRLHRIAAGDPETPFTMEEALPVRRQREHLEFLLECDAKVGAQEVGKLPSPATQLAKKLSETEFKLRAAERELKYVRKLTNPLRKIRASLRG
ncbi:putative nucleotide-diphospho-sugar transferase [Aliiroseovarius sp. S253]|uniref:putative nucleotide-diphospho-sugar transferase n=1 Tax=Aliiroseovarius sp. S253 TaxID=3415133 RepID=UPI003C7B560A